MRKLCALMIYFSVLIISCGEGDSDKGKSNSPSAEPAPGGGDPTPGNTDENKDSNTPPAEVVFQPYSLDELNGEWSNGCVKNELHSVIETLKVDDNAAVESLDIYLKGTCSEADLLYRMTFTYTKPTVSEEFSSKYGLPVDLEITSIEATYNTPGLVAAANKAVLHKADKGSGEIKLGEPVKVNAIIWRLSIDEKGEQKSETGVSKKVSTLYHTQTTGEPFYTYWGLFEGKLINSIGFNMNNGLTKEGRAMSRSGYLSKKN